MWVCNPHQYLNKELLFLFVESFNRNHLLIQFCIMNMFSNFCKYYHFIIFLVSMFYILADGFITTGYKNGLIIFMLLYMKYYKLVFFICNVCVKLNIYTIKVKIYLQMYNILYSIIYVNITSSIKLQWIFAYRFPNFLTNDLQKRGFNIIESQTLFRCKSICETNKNI